MLKKSAKICLRAGLNITQKYKGGWYHLPSLIYHSSTKEIRRCDTYKTKDIMIECLPMKTLTGVYMRLFTCIVNLKILCRLQVSYHLELVINTRIFTLELKSQ